MELARAEAIVRELLSPAYLNLSQAMVFRAAWQGQSYRDLAKSAGYEPTYIKGVGAEVWRILTIATNCQVNKGNFQQVLKSFDSMRSSLPKSIAATGVSAFYGRKSECSQLYHWIVNNRCRLVAILGMGGMGKTTISIELCRQLQAEIAIDSSPTSAPFRAIVWRSLLNAPPLPELLPELIRTLQQSQIEQPEPISESAQFLPDRQSDRQFNLASMPPTVTGQIELLLKICQQYRCLIVLDNVESIFQSGVHVSQYRSGYDDYGDLFTALGQIDHQSCLLLTSREKPTEISQLAEVNTQVKTLMLPGLDAAAGQQIFADRGCLDISARSWAEIDRYCGGNPLAFQLIAATIQEVADGDVSEIFPYLRSHELGFADIHVLLEQQCERLTAEERQLMCWLAIAREPMSTVELAALLHPDWNRHAHDDCQRPEPMSQSGSGSTVNASLLTVLQSLHRRCAIGVEAGQIDHSNCRWSLQPMVIEYTIGRFVAKICTEIEQQQPACFNTHAIAQANTKEYLRQAQLRLIVQPAIDRLRTSIGNPTQIGAHLRSILAQWRIDRAHQSGYLAGNILNFLTHLKLDLADLDCSELVIQQAYLVDINLANVNFANAQIVDCAFTQTFSSVLAIAYSPDGQTLAASDSSGKIRIWGARNRQCLLTCVGHTNWVRAIVFSPDGRSLASSSDDRTIKIWDLRSGICLHTIGAGIHSFGLSFSPDGGYLASGSANHTIYYWDLQTGTCVREFVGHQNWSIDVQFHPHGHQLVSGGADCTLRIWDVASGDCNRVLAGHDNWVTTVDYSPDGQTILSGSLDGTLRLWEVEWFGEGSGYCQDKCHPAANGLLLPTERLLPGQTRRYRQRLRSLRAAHQPSWELGSGRWEPIGNADSGCRLVVTGHGDEIWAAVFSPDGQTFASAGVGGLLRVWRTSNGDCLHQLEGHSNRLWSIAFHPDGHYLASGGEDQSIRFWQIENGKCCQILNGYTNWFRSIAWSPDCHRLVTASRDSQLRVWSIDAEPCLQALSGHTSPILTIATDPQGLTFASGSDDRTIRIWDAQTLACIEVLRGHAAEILALVYSPDGHHLVSAGSDLSIRIWDTQTGQCVTVLTGHTDRIGGLAYHPQLDLIASASEDSTIKIWSLHESQPVHTLSQHTNRAIAVAFDPGGKVLASGGMDTNILLWNVETGALCHTLTGHSGWILSLAYSLDGQWLFSGATDDTIKVWSVATGLCIDTLVGHQGWVWSVAVSPCGGFLASASEDETIKIWDLVDLSLISTRRACRPYEGLNITGIAGLTKAEIDGLKILGAWG